MPILSEGRGIFLWLKSKGVDHEFGGYIQKIYKEKTGVSFHKVTYRSSDTTKFTKFACWFGNQDLKVLRADYAAYKKLKQEQKDNKSKNLKQ